jgi:hypothetical protein
MQSSINRRGVLSAALATTAATALALPSIAAAAEQDPVIAMCDNWHALHREMQAAYNRVPDEPGEAHDTAWAEAEVAHDRMDALYDRIAETAPMSVKGIAAQASVAAAMLEESYGSEADKVVLCAREMLSNIARFAG